jgi:HSP90 family molecular chaperone
MSTDSQTYPFKAEIKQLLDILVHSLYKEREIFLRELISNASDALTRLHFESLTNSEIHDPDAALAIHIEIVKPDEAAADEAAADSAVADKRPQIIIRDSGVGMTREELVENLGTIAQSGAKAFLAQLKSSNGQLGDIIGQFGVGFYSVFMVADEVQVTSRSYRPEVEAVTWISHGDDSFQIVPASKSERGTEVRLFLRPDAAELASKWQLRQIIKKHSDFIGYPIYIEGEQANQQTSLWRKQTADVADDDYRSFYQQLTMDFEPPLATIHLSSDAPVHTRALLFIPARRERGILAARTEPGLKLYSHNVLIQEYCTDLLPKWLAFVDGVVDSEDLPLNVSRETVQNNRIMRQLGKTLRRRVLRELETMAEKEAEKFSAFWEQFGRALKEGLALEPEAKEELMPLFRFHSSKSDGRLTSLDDYLSRMAADQEAIYYVLGDSLDSVSYSPHLDPFKAHDLEVLYWVDPLDAFMAPILTEYKGKKLKNVDDAGLELPAKEDEATAAAETPTLDEADFNRLIGRCVTTLGDRVVEVRPSKTLRDSPVRLVAPEGAANREMDRLRRFLDQQYETPKRILEVNRNHPLIGSLARLVADEPEAEVINLTIEQLYESALVQEGLHPNPVAMLPRIQKLMELAAGQ